MKKALIFVLALGLCLGLAMDAMAGGAKVGGGIRLEFGYAWYNAAAGVYADDTFTLDQFDIANSRINFTYMSDDKKFKAKAEIAIKSRENGNGVGLRLGYFSYAWGSGSILFGQNHSLESSYGPSQKLTGDQALIGYGWAYLSRTEQIRLTLGSKYKLKLALESTKKDGTLTTTDAAGNVLRTDASYTYLPAMAAGLDLSFGNVNIYPWIRWEWNRYDNGTVLNYHSLDLGLRINGDFGLVGFTVGGHYGINTAMAGANTSGSAFGAVALWWNGTRSDHKQWNVFGELRIGGLAIGGGYAQATRDTVTGATFNYANDPWSASVYVNYKIPFGKITFVPEIGWMNDGEGATGADNGDVIRVGVWTYIAF